jgi:hypothetical protein
MFIPDPDFYPSRIPDPKTAAKDRGSHKFHIIKNYFVLEMLKKKKFGPIFKEL